MEYLTSEETAQKWNISARRVTTLCRAGRIDGAIQKSGVWLIPDYAKEACRYEARKKGG